MQSEIQGNEQNEQKEEKPGIESEQKTPFQSTPIREFYDKEVSEALLAGLRELGKQRPENAVSFLGKYLLDYESNKK